ncbi:MAG: LptF/LptG family permease [Beijerinckiaceae bacterium]
MPSLLAPASVSPERNSGFGVSLARIVLSVMKLGSVFVLASLVVGEFIAPPSEEVAQHRKSIATTNQIALRAPGGFWARDGRSYINIRRALPGNRVEEVYIYEFDDQNRLRVSTSARQAYYKQGRWVLEHIRGRFYGGISVATLPR